MFCLPIHLSILCLILNLYSICLSVFLCIVCISSCLLLCFSYLFFFSIADALRFELGRTKGITLTLTALGMCAANTTLFAHCAQTLTRLGQVDELELLIGDAGGIEAMIRALHVFQESPAEV